MFPDLLPMFPVRVNAWDRRLVRRFCVACNHPIATGSMSCVQHPTAAVRGEVVS
jgi:hypothetical protein